MEFVEITPGGVPARDVGALPAVAVDVLKFTGEMYASEGYQPPWVGYLAMVDGSCVGTCAFKSAPVNDRVEIAYFTFAGHEGRGVATAMAGRLLELAARANPAVRVFAQTLPESRASARVLEKLGFQPTRDVMHPEDGRVREWERSDTTASGPTRS